MGEIMANIKLGVKTFLVLAPFVCGGKEIFWENKRLLCINIEDINEGLENL